MEVRTHLKTIRAGCQMFFSLVYVSCVYVCVCMCLRVISQSWHILRVITFSSILFFSCPSFATVRRLAAFFFISDFFFPSLNSSCRVDVVATSGWCCWCRCHLFAWRYIEGWMVALCTYLLIMGVCALLACLRACLLVRLPYTHSHHCTIHDSQTNKKTNETQESSK